MSETIQQVQQAFTAYTIERELGAGGMATVYLAHDKKHDRKVAIKVLHAELAAVLGAERFLQEIRVTANLQHPHILGLIDSGLIGDDAGELRGRPYYVMPFVEGESLRQRLDKEQQLPVSDSVRIATEVASALDYAHRHSVIHRDIKPENILLHDGTAIVADFGIALAVTQAGGSRMTQTGLSLGTPSYMSPEQAMGERTITARSDIYSLGAVTYEMLSGEPPFTGPTVQAVVARVMTEEPRPLTSQRRSVPPHVEAAVSRALQKVPADRFVSAHEFADALTGEHPVRASDVPSHALSLGKRRQRRAASIRVAATLLVALATGVALGVWVRPRPQQRFARLPIGLPDSAALTPNRWGSSVALSPDGSRLVYLGPRSALYVRSVDDFDSRLLEGTDHSSCPSFSPDGRWILYASEDGKITRIAVSGGSPVVIADHASCGTWTDRDEVVFIGDDGGVYRVPVKGGNPVRVLSADSTGRLSRISLSALPGGSANEWQPKLSNDGKYLAYTSDETGRAEVYVQPVPGPGRRVQLSADGGTEPVWDLDSRHVYYRGPRHMMRATVATSPQLELVRGDTLFEDTYDREGYAAFYDVMPGGKELLMQRNESRPRLAMEFNWPVLLRQDNASR